MEHVEGSKAHGVVAEVGVTHEEVMAFVRYLGQKGG